MTRTVALAPAGRSARAVLGYFSTAVLNVFIGIGRAASRHAERRRCLTYLMSCDHRQLEDIGIDRWEIRRMVWGRDHPCR